MKPSNHPTGEPCVTLSDLKASLTELHEQLRNELRRELLDRKDSSWILREDTDGIGSDRDHWMCKYGRHIAVEQALTLISELESKSTHNHRSGGVE